MTANISRSAQSLRPRFPGAFRIHLRATVLRPWLSTRKDLTGGVGGAVVGGLIGTGAASRIVAEGDLAHHCPNAEENDRNDSV
jgi:hypothetical protein